MRAEKWLIVIVNSQHPNSNVCQRRRTDSNAWTMRRKPDPLSGIYRYRNSIPVSFNRVWILSASHVVYFIIFHFVLCRHINYLICFGLRYNIHILHIFIEQVNGMYI